MPDFCKIKAWNIALSNKPHPRKHLIITKIWICYRSRISKHLTILEKTRLDILGPSPLFWMSTKSERMKVISNRIILVVMYPLGALLPCISNRVTPEAISLMDPVNLQLLEFWTTIISLARFLDPINWIITQTKLLCPIILHKNSVMIVKKPERALRLRTEKVFGATKTQQPRKMPKWDRHLDTSRLDHISSPMQTSRVTQIYPPTIQSVQSLNWTKDLHRLYWGLTRLQFTEGLWSICGTKGLVKRGSRPPQVRLAPISTKHSFNRWVMPWPL